MKRIVIFSICAILYAWNTAVAMEWFTKQDDDVTTAKTAINRTRQYAALGSVGFGFTFFAATATRHMHWPYWAKRVPLFGFVSCNAIAQLPTITGVEQDPAKLAFVGRIINKTRNTK